MLRDNLVELIEPMRNSAGADPLALGIYQQKPASDDSLSCLENPRPEGAESSLTENVASPFPAEPRQLKHVLPPTKKSHLSAFSSSSLTAILVPRWSHCFLSAGSSASICVGEDCTR